MTVSIRVMSAGTGYAYLLRTVVTGDAPRDFATPLTRYYQEKGTPPGYWLGSGLSGLGNGVITAGGQVTEEQLRRLIGHGLDPITGEQLGRPYLGFGSTKRRADERIAALPAGLSNEEREAQAAQIRLEEARRARAAVAGFDLTFSVPKSVSVLWALSEAATQAVILELHHQAVADVLNLLERTVVMTRTGAHGVAQVQTCGVAATAFDHYDSRAGDPQLHTHVVVANKVQAVSDGKWRTLDSRALFGAVVAASEHFNAVLADQLTARLGLGWELRERGRGRNPEWELTCVPEQLIGEFSSRTRDIDAAADKLIAAYRAEHGRMPGRRQILRLRQEATLATRPQKQLRSLAELVEEWQARAAHTLGQDAAELPVTAQPQILPAAVIVAELPDEAIGRLAAQVVAVVGERRSTWRYWNLHAEASRLTRNLRLATVQAREELTARIAETAEQSSLRLTPPQLAHAPAGFTRADGSSAFRPRHSDLYSSEGILHAEDALLELSEQADGPCAPATRVQHALRAQHRGVALGADQVQAVERVATSGRPVDVLVGPAGSGKTTTMRALRRVWERRFGPGSVIGLAPSAAAAEVLGVELGIRAENTAKWLFEHDRSGWALRPGQLVILDEASLAGTVTLDRLAQHAASVGAKLLLLGDEGQLSSPEACGAFGMLVRTRGNAPALTGIRRFTEEWEQAASLGLRAGHADALAAYEEHGRIAGGGTDEIIGGALAAWQADRAAGRRTLMIAHSAELARDLNARARAALALAGLVFVDGVALADGNTAGTGDTIMTRQNDRTLRLHGGWVANGDRFQVRAVHADGSLTVRRTTGRGSMTLPPGYVAEHVELGYAVTAHRAQGLTVDTAHTVVAGRGLTRETLYVAMTRARSGNHVYVATDQAELEDHQLPLVDPDARGILAGILAHPGAELSARETMAAEQLEYGSIRRLAAEYDTLALAAQEKRWTALIKRSVVPAQLADEVVDSDAFGPLAALLRRAEAEGYDVDALLPALVAERDLSDADDPGKVLHYRLGQAVQAPPGRRPSAGNFIAGLIPTVRDLVDDDMRRALHDRETLIRQRAVELVKTAILDRAAWLGSLGPLPAGARARTEWLTDAATVAAYHDRYSNQSGGTSAEQDDPVETLDRQRALAASRHARQLADAETAVDLEAAQLAVARAAEAPQMSR